MGKAERWIAASRPSAEVASVRSPWWLHFFRAGYMTCCESHARHYFLVMYDVGDSGECLFKLSLN